MIKDIVLHLSADAKHDVAVKYAVSVAEAFGANLAAVTFAYEAVLPLKSDDSRGADIARHLAHHDLNVDLKRAVAGGTDVANTILSYAADVSADFIVMGGYGHSRLREFILGGATRGVLSSMTIPTLMSH
jgi:nucleotide-binding universal stress UspA family protein